MVSNLVLSSLSWSDDGGVDWFATYRKQTDGPVLIEWNARRAGEPGNLSDHPSIEHVDQWMQQGEAAGVQPYSIHLPLHLSDDADQAGAEISAAAGWTDLASYMNAPLLRLEFTSDCQFGSLEAKEALRSILDYMSEMERRISVRFTQSLLDAWPKIIDGLDEGTLSHFGEDVVVEGDQAFSTRSRLAVLSAETRVADFDAERIQQDIKSLPIDAPYIIAAIGAAVH